MPRTKISKNSKRNRENADDKLTTSLRNFDTKVANFITELESAYLAKSNKISHAISNWKQSTPSYILNMTMKDLKASGSGMFAAIQTDQVNCAGISGYSNDDESSTNSRSVGKSQDHKKSAIGNKSVRRSKSVDNFMHHSTTVSVMKSTSKNPPILTNKNRMTPLSSHLSRSKYKTPSTNRVKAVSADRYGVIKPKFLLDEPIAMLRYANVGETVVSVTGSPVVGASQGIENRATVNIPIKNGVISLRPTEIKSFDEQLVGKIDSDTLNHLKLLQRNIHFLTQMAENKLN